MTTVRRIVTSRIDGEDANNNSINEIRPFGETSFCLDTSGENNKLVLMMFDGTRTNVRSKVLSKGTFYGGDADSSDGLSRDTIKLVPDEDLRRNGSDQYLVVDPTAGEPGHIHIRAGGTIDQSNADLFLGGEKNNVRVSDIYNSVTITTDVGFDDLTRTWVFDSNGDLRLPGGSNGRIGESEPGVVVRSDIGFAVLTNANTENSKSWIFNDSGVLRLPGSATVENTATVLAAGTIITVPVNAADDTNDYTGGASVLEIPKNADTNQVQPGWIITFSNDVQRTVGGIFDGGSYWSVQYNEANPGLGSNTYPLTIQSADYNVGSDGSVTIAMDNIEGNPIAFSFGSDGIIRMPNDSLIVADGNNVELRNLTNFNVEAEGVVNIYTDANGVARQWQFGDDGVLTLPGGGDIRYNSGVSVITPQGEYLHEFTGLNTDLTFTNIAFNLLYCRPALGYLGSDTHNVNLPAGTPGQRLVIINTSNFCTLTVNNGLQVTFERPAEFIYSAVDSEWISLYGAVSGV